MSETGPEHGKQSQAVHTTHVLQDATSISARAQAQSEDDEPMLMEEKSLDAVLEVHCILLATPACSQLW